MTPEQAIHHFGSLTKLARALGAAPSTVYEWIEKGAIPDGRQYQIELATDGILIADRPACRVDDCANTKQEAA